MTKRRSQEQWQQFAKHWECEKVALQNGWQFCYLLGKGVVNG